MPKRHGGRQDSPPSRAPRTPLVVTVDGPGQVVDMVGNPAVFGSLAREEIGRLLLDLLVGSDRPAGVLQAVGLADGHFADIHIVPEDDLKHFVLLDSSELMRSLRRKQQLGNGAALQQERDRRSLQRALPVDDEQSCHQATPFRKSAGVFSTLVGEMREPLALLAGHVATLARHRRNDPVALRSIAMLQHLVVRLDALSSNGLIALGECSEVEAGTGVVDLQRLAGFILDVFSFQAAGLGIDLTIDVPEEQATLELDDQALRQVLINLIMQALGGMEQGRLELTMSATTRHLEVELNAEPAGFRAELFGPLITTSDLLHSNSTGSLALAVTQKILLRMEALVELVPRSDGGFLVLFRLPLRSQSRRTGTSA